MKMSGQVAWQRYAPDLNRDSIPHGHCDHKIVSHFFGIEVGRATARHKKYPYSQEKILVIVLFSLCYVQFFTNAQNIHNNIFLIDF